METPRPQPGEPGFLDWVRSHSGLRLDREATFLYRDAPVEHPRVVRLFKQGLGRDAEGRVTLTVGRMWCWVDADGPLFRARRALCEAEGDRLARCVVRLDDDREEVLELRAGALAVDRAGVLHVRVRGGREWARCIPEAQLALGRFVGGERELALVTVAGPVAIGGAEALAWERLGG